MAFAPLIALVAALGASPCPQADRGETALDCPWAAFGRRLAKEADAGRNIEALLGKLAPQLVAQLQRDAQHADWLQLWTDSLNRNPANEALVDPRILAVLGKILGVGSADDNVVHAGLQNTYGYLFSLRQTAGAYPRERWVRGDLERGFGLPPGLLGPLPSAGTFLGNVTYLLGRFALADGGREKQILDTRKDVPAPLRSFDYAAQNVRRLEERVTVPLVTGREIILRTDVVALAHPTAESHHLVIYSWFDPSYGGARLLAGFPASTAYVNTLFAKERLGDDIVVNSAHFGYIEGLTGSPQPHLGSRHVVSRK